MRTIEDIKFLIRELCLANGLGSSGTTFDTLLQKSIEYLSLNGSSIDTLFQCLSESIDMDNSILVASAYIKKLLDKIEEKNVLQDCETIDLSDRFLNSEELASLNAKFGVIDSFGVFHSAERNIGIDPSHKDLACYLKEANRIIDDYIRVGNNLPANEGIFSASSLTKLNLKDFLLTEKMAIALYNGVMSRHDGRYSTFEEKLSYYGDDFGYHSIKYNFAPVIYDHELFENNMKVLTYTLGRKFDKSFFVELLEKN